MEYKMSELSQLSGLPKSTILYYLKEGLLPEAKKIKPNVHRYNDEHLKLLRYIKYMQGEMGSSIEQLKRILQHKNQSLSSSFSMLATLMETLRSTSPDAERHDSAAFSERFSVDPTLLERLVGENVIVPTGESDFTEKELSIITLIGDLESVGMDYGLLKAYAEQAEELARLECAVFEQLCRKRTDDNFPVLWKIIFDLLFQAKPYLFSRHTHNALRAVLMKELSTDETGEAK